MRIALTAAAAATAALAACAEPPESTTEDVESIAHAHDDACGWSQWGQNAAHDGASCSPAQPANRLLAKRTMDPFVPPFAGDDTEAVFTHYQVPLTDGDNNVFTMVKSGTLTDDDYTTQVWSERRMHWHGGELHDKWQFDSDWKAAPFSFETMFHPALHGDEIWIPGAHGSVYVLDKESGHVRAHHEPFGADVDTYLVGGIAIGADGDVYYNALEVDPADPAVNDIRGSWLVHIKPNGHASKVSYADLVPDGPAATDTCYGDVFDIPRASRPPFPFPPAPNADGSPWLPPAFACGSQRAAVNAVPAIADDGTVYVVSRAHAAGYYGYLVAVRPNLTPKWDASLRGRLNDGCGVTDEFCSAYGAPGIDEYTNMPPAGYVEDYAASSPVVLPDGRIVVGALTIYNDGRGHLFSFTKHGAFDGFFTFGWDVTPAVYRHDGTFSIVIKDNWYFDLEDERYLITQLDPHFNVEWSFRATNTLTCHHDELGNVVCEDEGFNPFGFEWCMDAPAVDAHGNVYGTSEDGNLYIIGQGGGEVGHFFLDNTRAAAYTPAGLDPRGRIYALNNGELFVIGQ